MDNQRDTVFISYSQDSPSQCARVRSLSNRLREMGFDCDIDQYHVNENWPAWMERRIETSTHVLVICTPTYLRRWNNQEPPNVGLGAQWESLLTRQHLYQAFGTNEKFVPVVFESNDICCIPTPLAGVSRIDLSLPDGFDRLRCRLLNIPSAEAPPIRSSLAPFALAEGFFRQTGDSLVSQFQSATQVPVLDHFGLSGKCETLFSSLFPVSFATKIQSAKVKTRHKLKIPNLLFDIWKRLNKEDPPVDFLVEGKTIYTFRDMNDPYWVALSETGAIQPMPSIPSADWAQSAIPSDRSRFVKLLNRCLADICRHHEMEHRIAFSKDMNCYLFISSDGRREGHIKVQAITKAGRREIYRAIPNKLLDDPNAIQHWKHQAFRHSFVPFDQKWFLNIVPFWAFTSDGVVTPSRWQKSSSRNMRKPERNRAVLGHIMFWAAILCRDPDMVRREEPFRIHRPFQLKVTPSISDSKWVDITKGNENQVLQQDLKVDILL